MSKISIYKRYSSEVSFFVCVHSRRRFLPTPFQHPSPVAVLQLLVVLDKARRPKKTGTDSERSAAGITAADHKKDAQYPERGRRPFYGMGRANRHQETDIMGTERGHRRTSVAEETRRRPSAHAEEAQEVRRAAKCSANQCSAEKVSSRNVSLKKFREKMCARQPRDSAA